MLAVGLRSQLEHLSSGLADKLDVHAVEVDAIDQQAKAFYEKYGFAPLLDNEFHLFLPITTVQAIIKRP